MQTQTVNISLPRDLIRKADEVAKRQYSSRSELVRTALRSYLEKRGEWDKLFAIGEKVVKRVGIKSEEEVNKIVSEFRHGSK